MFIHTVSPCLNPPGAYGFAQLVFMYTSLSWLGRILGSLALTAAGLCTSINVILSPTAGLNPLSAAPASVSGFVKVIALPVFVA